MGKLEKDKDFKLEANRAGTDYEALSA